MIDGWGISGESVLIWMSLDFTDDQSTLVQVMAWCRQATSHYLGQCWPRSLSPYGVTRPQWVNMWQSITWTKSDQVVWWLGQNELNNWEIISSKLVFYSKCAQVKKLPFYYSTALEQWVLGQFCICWWNGALGARAFTATVLMNFTYFSGAR